MFIVVATESEVDLTKGCTPLTLLQKKRYSGLENWKSQTITRASSNCFNSLLFALVSNERFQEQFQELTKYGDDPLVCVIEDDKSGKIVATGSVFVEKKFVRNCGKVGHIEDVVDSSIRGKQLGKKIIEFLSDHARLTGWTTR
ncbi:unnamed protein product [Fraxinus pennsylvanica]|uniref:Glucosamine 6-phosphate N-acetyltransferase n=1 Tax=Fraxinus pennsylvanica TaxID=56036 RepID=A0AAD2DVL5_9LAMI|nr:unnamed protein product [Fraxinus pennsylvanica]